jgi:hypothetical protein
VAKEAKRFETVLEKDRRGRVYFTLPFDPDKAWGSKPTHRVHGRVNGMGYRGAVERDDDGCRLVLGAAWRRDCGLSSGDPIEVQLQPEGPQRDDLDPDVAAALAASPAGGAFFDSLAQFYRKAYLTWIGGTKRRPDERARRIAEMVALLQSGAKERPKS